MESLNTVTTEDIADLLKPGRFEEHVFALAAKVSTSAIQSSAPNEALMHDIKSLQAVLPKQFRERIQRAVDWHESGRPALNPRLLTPSGV